MKRPCPADNALIALFMNEATPRAKDKTLRHIAACRRCAFRLNVLRQVKRDLQPQVDTFVESCPPGEGASLLQAAAWRKIAPLDPAPPSPAPRPHPLGMLLGFRVAVGFLALLVVATAAGYFVLTGLGRRAELRSPSARLTLLAPVGALTSLPSMFRWTPVLGAEAYHIEVIDETLGTVGRAGAFIINEVIIPADLRARLAKGRTYVWTVWARDGDGNVLTSRSASFIIE